MDGVSLRLNALCSSQKSPEELCCGKNKNKNSKPPCPVSPTHEPQTPRPPTPYSSEISATPEGHSCPGGFHTCLLISEEQAMRHIHPLETPGCGQMSGSDVTPRLSSPVQSLVHEIPPKIKSQVSQEPFLGEEILACGSKHVRCEERQTPVSPQTRVETAERKKLLQPLTGSLGREIAPPSVSGLHQLGFSFWFSLTVLWSLCRKTIHPCSYCSS